MGAKQTKIPKNHICIGLLAHVDAGKTTLSEAILYATGRLRKLGRVDDRSAFLDTYALERARGITIFSKQAEFSLGETAVTLLDTPGHVDFSTEMERTLPALDYAVLIISGADGVQGHTETLWRLLKRYRIPTFLFVNKMDQNGTDRAQLLLELKKRLDGSIIDFTGMAKRQENGEAVLSGDSDSARLEEIAMSSEALLERYLESGTVTVQDIVGAIGERKLFPCYFGSALKLVGVEELLLGLELFCTAPQYGERFGARVFKIARDEQGNRLTYLKITGGRLRVRETLEGPEGEKVSQIRRYSGAKYEPLPEAGPGEIVAVTGPLLTRPGQGLGAEKEVGLPLLEPVLTYRILLPDGTDALLALADLRQLEDEDPMLHLVWNESFGEIRAQVMGEVQMDVLKAQAKERFGLSIDFGAGSIVYKETIRKTSEGVGHFEPLRHYAEVHLLLEPGEPGSGLVFETDCSEEMLARNWQRLILTHLEEKRHRGVLTGSEITDMKITLVAGRAHLKHTEGGDFRQATYRAVRQGLKEGGCRLLEPYYAFHMEIPTENLGRALTDLDRMQGKFDAPQTGEEFTILTGRAPAALMRDYQRELTAYTKGRGHMSLTLGGYEACHNEEEVTAQIGYDFDLDLQDPAGSVFCSHGAGFTVPWDEVRRYMQVPTPAAVSGRIAQENGGTVRSAKAEESPDTVGVSSDGARKIGRETVNGTGTRSFSGSGSGSRRTSFDEDKELREIFYRTYGKPKERTAASSGPQRVTAKKDPDPAGKSGGRKEPEEEYLLVDGYNIIFAWEELAELAKRSADAARYKLMDILCNYQGFRSCTLIVVFDAYKVAGNPGEVLRYHNIHVVYTKEAETADQYIEKLAHKIGRERRVTVATSDGLEQLIIRGQGCTLISAREFKKEVERVGRLIREETERLTGGKNYLLSHADEEIKRYLEQVRLGEISPEVGR